MSYVLNNKLTPLMSNLLDTRIGYVHVRDQI